MKQLFVNRHSELAFLEKRFSNPNPEFLVIYGRRRVGKSCLLSKFSKNKSCIYFLCTKDSERENINRMKSKMANLLGSPMFEKLEIDNWIELFKYFFEFYDGTKKIVFIFDEFPYLIELKRGITSVFQHIWDEMLSSKNVMLILTGSSIGMMETEVLGYHSPLYGRRTGQWKVTEVGLEYFPEFLPKYSMEDICRVYGVVGGIPAYLGKFDADASFFENMAERFIKKGEFLNVEPELLLKAEFREEKNYFLILKALALGHNTNAKVVAYTGLEKGNISKYLHVLENLMIVRHILPIGKHRGGIYIIEDPLFAFWFKFIYPNRDDIELENYDAVAAKIKMDFPSYMGHRFELLCEDLIRKHHFVLPITPTTIGKWWHREEEIDIIARDEENLGILFCEVKWKNLGKNETLKLFESLKKKSALVKWRNDGRKEYYSVIAKKINGKKELADMGYFVYDLDDFK
ncbi:MAG: AAA family ATPase [Methanosarcinaceae archaeon]|nr:AAA family ATPase [Methanosarcinaceae archaeon]